MTLRIEVQKLGAPVTLQKWLNAQENRKVLVRENATGGYTAVISSRLPHEYAGPSYIGEGSTALEALTRAVNALNDVITYHAEKANRPAPTIILGDVKLV